MICISKKKELMSAHIYLYSVSVCLFVCSNFAECSTAAGMELLSRQTVPFWWDDAANHKTLEDIAVAAFNKVRFYLYNTNISSQHPYTYV